ncbi:MULTISPECIES: transposase [Novosphingobium]|uniref:transposase n=1 Tax=Novosphingobium TaxID=165696 RepID=UPI001CD5D08D
MRDECFNEALFILLARARFVLAAWSHGYNTVRPHSKLGGKDPTEIESSRVCGRPVGLSCAAIGTSSSMA